MSSASNSNVPVRSRGSAFNVKGLRKIVAEPYVRNVFAELLPGSHICIWVEKSGKRKRRVGRVSVTPQSMHEYPEFQESLKNPGKDIEIEVGPFELTIWTRKPKRNHGNARSVQTELDLLREELEKQKQRQQRTQAMLDHLLEPAGGKLKKVDVRKKRPPKLSPVHKRMKVIQDDKVMKPVQQTEQEAWSDLKSAVEAHERKIKPMPPARNTAVIARLTATLKGIT